MSRIDDLMQTMSRNLGFLDSAMLPAPVYSEPVKVCLRSLIELRAEVDAIGVRADIGDARYCCRCGAATPAASVAPVGLCMDCFSGEAA
jgi:hypothetical protein